MKATSKLFISLTAFVVVVGASSFYGAKLSRKKLNNESASNASIVESSNQNAAFSYQEVGKANAIKPQPSGSQKATKYTVNVRSFNSRDEAEKLLDSLSSTGLMGYYTPVRQGEKVVYHVRLGIYSDQNEAKKTLGQLQAKAKIAGSVSQLH